jgi:hypothetical protein
MTDLPAGGARHWTRARLLATAAILAGVAVFVAANAHLVLVAVGSQPDCVPHLKDPGDGAAYRAAASSC